MAVQRSSTAALVGALLIGFMPLFAHAQVATIEVGGAQSSPALQLPVQTLDGSKPYISLVDLVQRLGGGTTLTPSRMRIDLQNTTAWIGLNDNRVNALTIFTVANTIIANDDGVFMAVADCEAFFNKAFRMQVRVISDMDARSSGSLRDRLARPQDTPEPTDALEPITGETPLSPPPAMPPTNSVIRNILISPGHGGFDNGVQGATGALEKDITLNIALQIRDLLTADESLNVKLIREEDVSLTQQQRGAALLTHQPDILIALHLGGSFSPETRGAAVFYTRSDSQTDSTRSAFGRRAYTNSLASIDIGEAIMNALQSEAQIPSRGVHGIPNSLLDKADCPALLVELGCLTNSDEEQRLVDPSYQLKIAEAIIKGIRAFNTQDPATAAVPDLNNNSRVDGPQ